MATNIKEQDYRKTDNNIDIPDYMEKLDALNDFDNKYGLLKEEDKNIDDLYTELKELQIEMKNYINKKTDNYVDGEEDLYYINLEKEINSKKKELNLYKKDFDKRFNNQYLINNKLKKNEYDRLNKLNEVKYKKKLHEYSIGEFFFYFKDNIFIVINSILNKKFDIDIYTKNNRLLHIGIFIILLCLIILIFTPFHI